MSIKRYSIVIKDKVETRPLDEEKSIKELKENIKKYNNNTRNPYFIGNFNVDYQRQIITFVRYKKITIPSTLEEIDASTINFNGDHELKKLYGIDPRNSRDLIISYRANNDIKTLPIIYKDKANFLKRDYLKREFENFGRDEKFLTLILNNKQIEYSARDSIEDFDNLYVLRDEIGYKLAYENPAFINTIYMTKFYNSFICEGGKFNYFTFRLLANLVIGYNAILEKENDTQKEVEPEKEVFGQMMIEEIAMQELKDKYEELKMGIVDGSLDEVYKHKLIPGRK